MRSDLSKSQQGVQAGHCVAEHLITNPDTQWTNGTLVYLKVPSEKDLHIYLDYFQRNEYEHASFREPDIGNEMTAISCYGHGELFKTLKLV